ncbi:hypothetical protein [Shewanella sp.]|uniref:hypothetical protein n=1 Tax=Shewanella sp. TaxID=50422 RepID=UPI001B46B4CA|nr:hypothetical protein [Shewanella sp.]MBP6518384.1 hypothetical protein [Shewanella sp.]
MIDQLPPTVVLVLVNKEFEQWQMMHLAPTSSLQDGGSSIDKQHISECKQR